MGITDFAQDALGEVVYVDHPAVGAAVAAGDVVGEVESTKSVSDIYAPVAGEITAVNSELDQQPQTVNAEPYGGDGCSKCGSPQSPAIRRFCPPSSTRRGWLSKTRPFFAS